MTPIISRVTIPKVSLSLRSKTGQIIQVRNHVKLYPWRVNRHNRECYLDPSKTPYTDKNNMNEFIAAKRKKKDWQIVIPKDKDNRFNRYKFNDNYKSDPVEAKQTAQSRLERFSQSLKSRGQARELVAYDPPNDVHEQVINICRSHLSSASGMQCNMTETNQSSVSVDQSSDERILAIDLNANRMLKFSLIKDCIKTFGHDLPNSSLNEMDHVSNVIEYFSTPVRGVNPYTALVRQESSLPPNLSLISEPIRFDRETDDFFQGRTAYPGMVNKVPGLRGAKKYGILNQDEFQWPDV